MLNKKIILLVDSSQYGGIEAHILNLSALLRENKVSATVVLLKNHANKPFIEKLSCAGLPAIVLDGSLKGLWCYLYHRRNDVVVHTHGYKAGVLARIVCKLLCIHCVSTFHAGEKGQGKLAIYNVIDRFTSGLSTNIAVSAKIQKQLKSSTQMDNFVNYIAPTITKQKTHLRLAFVGRLSPEKGPDIFASLSELSQHDHRLSFHMFGEGPMKQTLAKRANRTLSIHGFQSDMEDVWKSIDVLVIASREEGMPMVAIEAMMRSIPVISTPVGEVPQLLCDSRGTIADDISAESLKRAIEKWQSLATIEKSDLLKNAHQYVTEYCSGKKQMRELEQIYSPFSPLTESIS